MTNDIVSFANRHANMARKQLADLWDTTLKQFYTRNTPDIYRDSIVSIVSIFYYNQLTPFVNETLNNLFTMLKPSFPYRDFIFMLEMHWKLNDIHYFPATASIKDTHMERQREHTTRKLTEMFGLRKLPDTRFPKHIRTQANWVKTLVNTSLLSAYNIIAFHEWMFNANIGDRIIFSNNSTNPKALSGAIYELVSKAGFNAIMKPVNTRTPFTIPPLYWNNDTLIKPYET